MASASSVLAVIRAAHPELKSKQDRLAFAIHATFLASGYRLVGTGAAEVDPEEGLPGPEDDVSIEGWNSLGDAYTLRYVKDGDEQARPVVLSMLVVGDKLLVDATRLGSQGEGVHNLELKVDDYVTESESQNYAQLYKNLDDLVGRVQGSIIRKLSSEEAQDKKAAATPTTGGLPEGPGAFMPRPGPSPLVDDSQRRIPGIPAAGGYDPDLMPGGGAGIPPGYGMPQAGRGGMFVGPDDPFFVGAGVRPPHSPPGGLPAGLPPGARFDPYGPPIPGFEPGRFGDPDGGRRGGTHPDLDFRPPID
jgi:proteasome inhibitor subunit 1 (PI31)